MTQTTTSATTATATATTADAAASVTQLPSFPAGLRALVCGASGGIGAAFVIGALVVFGLLESRSTKTPEVL